VGEHRHKRDTEARRKPPALAVIAPLAVLATAGVVALGVGAADPAATDLTKISADAAPAGLSAVPSQRSEVVTRAEDRAKHIRLTPVPPNAMSKAAIQAAIDGAKRKQWTTDELNIWNQPGDKATQLGELEAGKKVLVTGRTFWGRTEIVLDGQSRWVTTGYLADEKPAGAGAGLSMEPCPDGSVENGLTDAAVYVYRSVCHAFPEITSYGGWDAHGEHASGKAIDIMTSDVTLGTAIAEFLQAHAAELDLYDVIWRQHIWTPVRASEGWRMMPSRGSATANHYDHVHVSVN
jgi:hypothetical protein